MIVLRKGINQVYITVSELNTINNAIYNLVIKEEMTHIVKSIVVLDTSVYAIRYNQFQVTVVDDINDEDLENGIVCLNQGKHTYSVIATNPLDFDNFVTCEIGIVKVFNDTVSIDKNYTSNIPPVTYISLTGNIGTNP